MTDLNSVYLRALRKIAELERDNEALKAELLKLQAEKTASWVQAQIDYDRFDG